MWQPHTSAGRVPTDLGYRFYVDSLLEARRASKDASAVEARLRPAGRRGAAHRRRAVERVARAVGGVAARWLCDCAGQRPGGLPPDRVRPARAATGSSSSWLRAATRCRRRRSTSAKRWTQSELVKAANYLNERVLRAGRSTRCARACSRGCAKSERSTISCWGSRCGWPASSLQSLERPTVCIDGTSTLLDEVVRASGLSMSTLRALLLMVEEKQRLVRLLNGVHRRAGPDGRHRRRAQRPRTASVQPDCLDLFRWPQHGHGGRHRPDADALLPRHRRRRECRESRRQAC